MRARLLVAALTAAALTLAGCGDSTSEKKTDTPASTAAAPAAPGAPVRGGQLVGARAGEVLTPQ